MINVLKYIVITIINCDLETFEKELIYYLNESGSLDKYLVNKINKPAFEEVYTSYPPRGGSNMDKILLWEPSNLIGQTVFFANSIDGRHTIILNYCKRYNRQAVKISFSNIKEKYPSYLFYYLDFSSSKNIERNVSLIKDGASWKFYSSGEIQYFENINYYNKTSYVKRINKKIILEYLVRLNIDITDENFWTSSKPCYLIVQTKW